MSRNKAVIAAVLLILIPFLLTACQETLSNQKPIASSTASPTSGEVPLEVSFNASESSDPDGTIVDYSWNFGDGNIGNGETTTHTYQDAGDYSAKLTVTDDEGATDLESQIISVNEPPPEPKTFQGNGDSVTQSFFLEEGVSLFHLSHNGNSNFAVWLVNANTGEKVELLVNLIGTFDGTNLVGITSNSYSYSAFTEIETPNLVKQVAPNSYLLDITADGHWEVTIEQPHPISAPGTPRHFSGHGYDVPPPFYLESGIATFTLSHDGSSNFSVVLYDDEGHYIDLLANEIGSYSGSKTVEVSADAPFGTSAGIHYLSITADGNWEIDVTQ